MRLFKKQLLVLSINLLVFVGIASTISGFTTSYFEGEALDVNYHSTSFSVAEGFTLSTTYNTAVINAGPENFKWDFLNGAVSSTNAITVSSAHLRGYSGAQSPRLETVFSISNLKKVVFSYKSDTNISLMVSHSTDNRVNWSEPTSFPRVTNATEVTYTVSNSGSLNATNLRWQMVNSGTSTGSSAELIIDDVTFFTIDSNEISARDFSTDFLIATENKANCTSDTGWSTLETDYNALSSDAKNEFKTNTTNQKIVDARERYNYLININGLLTDFVYSD
jgi:hypothetical protein